MQAQRLMVLTIAAAATLALAACDQVVTATQATSELIGSRSAPEAAVTFRARVVGVTDGDTLTVLDENDQQHTIRLAEIDAPERGQPWGARAKQALSSLVFRKNVLLQQTDTDRYGRVVARCLRRGKTSTSRWSGRARLGHTGDTSRTRP